MNKFIKFTESFKNDANASLIEAIQKGYKALHEEWNSEQYSDMDYVAKKYDTDDSFEDDELVNGSAKELKELGLKREAIKRLIPFLEKHLTEYVENQMYATSTDLIDKIYGKVLRDVKFYKLTGIPSIDMLVDYLGTSDYELDESKLPFILDRLKSTTEREIMDTVKK